MTAQNVAQIVVLVFLIYALVGVVFAVAFVFRGVQRIDPVAEGSPLGFRLLILPGSAALWPVLAFKWLRARSEPRGSSRAPELERPHS